ncbi:MAG TPA: glycosyltransferase, partial [Amaricoccus sp.]|nr:glycosyltransferase [Amaricoccus sp.]
MSGGAPRVSLFVLAYRQEATVAEAIAGAFAQSGPPLEILLSDDASPDGTFAVMQAMAAAYAGPHRVVLNRNATNRGLVGHLNRVMELVSGEVVVQNAGDDVSRPDRAARLAGAFAADPAVRAAHSAVRRIDAAGSTSPLVPDRRPMADVTAAEVIADSARGGRRHLIGAAMAWDRRLWDAFGPLPAAALIEDRPIAFRAALLGRIAWLDEPLLDYREGGASDGGSDGSRAATRGAHASGAQQRLELDAQRRGVAAGERQAEGARDRGDPPGHPGLGEADLELESGELGLGQRPQRRRGRRVDGLRPGPGEVGEVGALERAVPALLLQPEGSRRRPAAVRGAVRGAALAVVEQRLVEPGDPPEQRGAEG